MAIIHSLDTNAELQKDMGKLPSGTYLAQIVSNEIKAVNGGNGEYLECVYEVLDGEYKGRKHWQNYMIDHSNDLTVQIAMSAIATMKAAAGIPKEERDTDKFMFKPMMIRIVKHDAGTPYTSGKRAGQARQYDEAEIKGYSKAEGAAPSVSPAARQQTAAKQAESARPW